MSSKHLPLTDSLQAYLSDKHSGGGDPLLEELQRETRALFPERAEMQISAAQGTLLSMLASLTTAESIVEVGTFTGYSAICLARALTPGGHLLCCDISEEWTNVARRYWERAGISDRIELRVAPALDTLRALPADQRFDLAFVDADKTGYDAYFETLLPHMCRGGLFVFDNMLFNGRIEDATNESAIALNALNRKLSTDPRVESVLMPFADGLNLARVR